MNKTPAILGRRSIRKYTDQPVSEEEIKTLLECAMAAPSAMCRDPWRFVLLRDRASREAVAEHLPHGSFLPDAPLGIVVCGDLEAAHDNSLSFLLQDVSAAIENLLLAAHSLGLGCCWLGVHPREERIAGIRKVCGLPENILPVAVIPVGRPGEEKAARSRYDAAKVRNEIWS